MIGSVVFYRGLLLMVFSYLLFLLICFTAYHLHFSSSTLHASFNSYLPLHPGEVDLFWGMLLVQWIGCEVDWVYPIQAVSYTPIISCLLMLLIENKYNERSFEKV